MPKLQFNMAKIAKQNVMGLYDLFARILEPPGPSLSDEVNECISVLAPSRGKAAGLMYRFKTFVEQTPISRMEKSSLRRLALRESVILTWVIIFSEMEVTADSSGLDWKKNTGFMIFHQPVNYRTILASSSNFWRKMRMKKGQMS